jgi:hypothetical protein
MAFSLSPSVTVREVDLTAVVPAVSTSVGGAVIDAAWGPVMDVQTISSENTLVQQFGKPNDFNAGSWLVAANFLAYSNNCLVVRTNTTNQRNAVSELSFSLQSVAPGVAGAGYTSTGVNAVSVAVSAPPAGVTATVTATVTGGGITGFVVTNPGSGYTVAPSVTITHGSGSGATAGAIVTVLAGVKINNEADYTNLYSNGEAVVGEFAAKYPGALGNSLAVSVCDGARAGRVTNIAIETAGVGYTSIPTITISAPPAGPNAVQASATAVLSGGTTGTLTGIVINNAGAAYVAAPTVALVGGGAGTAATLGVVSIQLTSPFSVWEYNSFFDTAPNTSAFAVANQSTNDELHIVVIDTNGRWSGVAGTVLETFAYVSKASDGKKEDGSNAYYQAVLNTQSKYIWWMDHPVNAANWGAQANAAAYGMVGSFTRTLAGGVDHFSSTDGQKIMAFDLFGNAETLDISLLMCGRASATVANYVVQNIAEARKDCIAFISPVSVSGDILIGNTSDIADKIVAFRNLLPSSSYMVLDTGFKYQYDKYNDKYRWVALNGDIAGLCARTDETNDPWFSPAGLNRGGIKNVVKLAYSPVKTDRDNLYKSGINPVVSFPGQGVVLYGDKTGLSKPSAFDRINVRRLFITLEKSIATAAKFQLFEFNDAITRANFVSTITPFLRDVQGRRGIFDFRVVCDETNNTGQVIDTNRFIASIFIKPARSINNIELNFVAVRTGVSFSEIAGSV